MLHLAGRSATVWTVASLPTNVPPRGRSATIWTRSPMAESSLRGAGVVGAVASPGRAAPGTVMAHDRKHRTRLTSLNVGSESHQRVPPSEVVAGVDESVVALRLGRRQRRPALLVPQLAEVLGEPRDDPGQRRHRSPQLGQHHMVVGGEPGPQLELLAL